MTSWPIVVAEDEAIARVAELLAGYEISGLPVVDSNDRLVGVISQTDLVRLRGSTLPWTGWHGLMVRDLMTKPAKTILGSASLDEAARRLTAERVHRLIVVDDMQSPIGVISESDLVREIADTCNDGWASLPTMDLSRRGDNRGDIGRGRSAKDGDRAIGATGGLNPCA